MESARYNSQLISTRPKKCQYTIQSRFKPCFTVVYGKETENRWVLSLVLNDLRHLTSFLMGIGLVLALATEHSVADRREPCQSVLGICSLIVVAFHKLLISAKLQLIRCTEC